jgi:hypothetical protein
MDSLSLLAEQAEKLDRFFVGGAEPVRDPRIELCGLAGWEHEVVLSQDESEPAIEDVDPLVAFMGLQICSSPALAGFDDQLVRLDAAGTAGEREHGHAVALDGAEVDSGIPCGRRIDQLVQRHPVGLSQGEQQLKGGPALA